MLVLEVWQNFAHTTFKVIEGFYLHFIHDVILSISLQQGAVKLVRMYLKFEGVFFFSNFTGALQPLINPFTS